MSESLTIGALAKAADVHVETVRYYQPRGLLRERARPLNGIRRYGMAGVSRLRLVKRPSGALPNCSVDRANPYFYSLIRYRR
jgi:hypothetical protein